MLLAPELVLAGLLKDGKLDSNFRAPLAGDLNGMLLVLGGTERPGCLEGEPRGFSGEVSGMSIAAVTVGRPTLNGDEG